jgi:hypothetical protein
MQAADHIGAVARALLAQESSTFRIERIVLDIVGEDAHQMILGAARVLGLCGSYAAHYKECQERVHGRSRGPPAEIICDVGRDT